MTSRMNAAVDGARRTHQTSVLFEGDLIAVENDDGVTSVKVTDTDTVNLVWVKVYGSDERIVQAYNGRVQPRNKLPVWLRRLADGTYEIEGVRSRDGSDFLGEALGTMNIPELIGELLATVWPARNLKPGRARLSEAGGMTIAIEPFYYADGYFEGGDIDLTDYVPTTADTQVWAKIYFDPISDALGVTVSDSYTLAYTMLEEDLGDVLISPNAVPLTGVVLKYGDTTLSAASVIIAAQNWIGAPITNDAYFPIEITDTRSIPANRQIAVRRLAVTGSGALTVNGVLDVF